MLKKISLIIASTLLVACGEPHQIDKTIVEETSEAPQTAQQSISFHVPDYQQVVLDNGLTVMFMEHHEVPLVSINYISKAGYVQDGSAYGLADLTAESLRLGTETSSKAEIDAVLDNLGTDLSVWTSAEAAGLSLNVMIEDFDTSLDLLASLVTTPQFPEKEFNKLRDRTTAALKQKKEHPRNVVGNYFNALLYQGHPYAQPGPGNTETVGKLTHSQAKTFHQSYFAPQNGALIIVGDIEPNAIMKKVKSRWLNWENKQAKPIGTLHAPSRPDQARVLLVDKPDAREATFVIGGPGINYSHVDRTPLSVLNTILGGRFTSWLNDELRVNAGLTYGARSAFIPLKQGGAFRISTFTSAKDAEAGIDLALKTYSRLWEKGLDQNTLDSAKSYVSGGFPPQYETHSNMAGLLSDIYAYGMSVDYINQFVAKVNGLTLDVSKQLIETTFPREHLQFVVIGPADQLRDVVSKYGEVYEVSIEQAGFNGWINKS